MIEVELRSFVTPEEYERLFELFKREGEFLGTDEQETHYFEAPIDVRIQRNSRGAKIWMKGGAMHDEAREEIEIPVSRDDFSKLEHVFAALHFPVKVKWFRTRQTFRWQGITVTLDTTKGYGQILELEKLVEPDTRDAALAELKEKFFMLGVAITPKEAFAQTYADYCAHWQERVGDPVDAKASLR